MYQFCKDKNPCLWSREDDNSEVTMHELIRELDIGENENISLKMKAVCEEDKGPGNHQHGLDGGITTHMLDPHDDASLSFHRGRNYWHHALVLLCQRSRMRTEVREATRLEIMGDGVA